MPWDIANRLQSFSAIACLNPVKLNVLKFKSELQIFDGYVQRWIQSGYSSMSAPHFWAGP